MPDSILVWPRPAKQLAVLVLDLILSFVATWIAYALRLDSGHWPAGAQWYVYWLAPALAIPVFMAMGLYRAIFRYTGLAALLSMARAVAIYAVLLFLVLLWAVHTTISSVPALHPGAVLACTALVLLLPLATPWAGTVAVIAALTLT